MMSFAWTIFLCVMVFVIQLRKVFSINDADDGVYYPEERDALLQIRESLNSTLHLHSAWTGPPCLNNYSNWVGIGCLNSHVINVVLEGVELTGSLPPTSLKNLSFLSKLSFRNNALFGPLPDLTNLISLQFVVLSNNRFTGSIPSEYIDLPNLSQLELQENFLTGTIPPFNQTALTVLNVSNNGLQGEIPETTALLRFPEGSYDHNLELCGEPLRKLCPFPPVSVPPSPAPTPSIPELSKNRELKFWGIALIVVAAVVVTFVVMLVFWCYFRRTHGEGIRDEEHSETSVEWTEDRVHRSKSTKDPDSTIDLEFFNQARPAFNLDDLLGASAELMGKGSLGSTYKAMLESGVVVAVKRLKEMNGLRKKEFVQQMRLLGKMRHENLVEILSFYYSRDEKLIVYEFVEGRSLFELLHDNRGARVPLDWTTRLLIIKGIARGLAFLHQSLPSHKVPHANLKSSNVLIQHHSHPKLADFGFYALVPPRKLSGTLAVGKAPELFQGKKLTHKADVYCFGLIVLELVTGRIPGEFSQGDGDVMADGLSEWVRSVVCGDWPAEILDLEIAAEKEAHEEMFKLTDIALECTSSMPDSRPKMSEVLERIEETREETESRTEAEEVDVENA